MKSLIFILVLIVIIGVIVFIVFPDSLSKQNVSLDKKTPAPSGESFKPEGFKGPTGPPGVIGPSGPPPNY